jgi:hypothetical protein
MLAICPHHGQLMHVSFAICKRSEQKMISPIKIQKFFFNLLYKIFMTKKSGLPYLRNEIWEFRNGIVLFIYLFLQIYACRRNLETESSLKGTKNK